MLDDRSPLLPISIDGAPVVRVDDRLIRLPSGAEGEEPTPSDAPPAAPPAEAPAPDPAPVPPAEEASALPELPANLTEAEEDALRSLHAELEELYTARREGVQALGDLEAIREIRERQNAIAGELNRRRQEAAQIADELAALDGASPEALPEAVPAMASVGLSAAQLAAARGTQPPVAQDPPAPSPARPRAPMLAAVGGEQFTPGQEISIGQLGVAFDRFKGQAGDRVFDNDGRGTGGVMLASLGAFEDSAEFDRSEMLHADNGPNVNDRLIRETQEAFLAQRRGETLTAHQAAICDPLDYIREIPSAFSTAEPVRAIFPSRPAGRLGFQFTPSILLSDVSSGVTLWDEADQAAVVGTDAATWKPCVAVICPPISNVRAEAVPGCLTFDLTTEMSNPARIQNATDALNAVRARTKEGRILELIDRNSSKFRYTGDYGALPNLIEALNTMVAQAVYANRIDDPAYTVILPPAVAQILTIDRANRAYGVEAEVQDVLAYLRGSIEGVSAVVESLDASLGGEPGIPFPALPATTAAGGPAGLTNLPYIEGGDYRIRLVDPAAAIYAETGEMNVGVARDTSMLRQNRSQYFVEDFFMLAKNGPSPWMTVDMVLCADGSRAGLVTPDGCATS